MCKYKAVFFDIDGTLLSHRTGKVPDSTLEALARLRENHIHTVISSGRHPTELKQLNIDLSYYDSFITTNGQIVLDRSWNIIAENPIPEDKRPILVKAFEEKRIPMQINTIDELYMNFINDRVRRVLEEIHTPLHDVGQYRGEKLFQVVAYVEDIDAPWVEEISKHFHVTSWHSNGIDIITNNGGKAWGIEAYLKAMGFDRKQTVAFGDGANDLEMISYSGCGIAMGNAVDSLKEAADLVTDDIDEDGLYNACRKIGYF